MNCDPKLFLRTPVISGKAALLAAIAFVVLSPSARATPSFSNGTFSTTCTGTQTTCTNGSGQLGLNINATGWTNGTVGASYGSSTATTYGYNFLYTSTSAATTGATGANASLSLYNGTGGTNTLTGATNGGGITGGAIPGGGNFMANDGAYNSAAIMQLITGLTIGKQYVVGFWWAGAQQTSFSGITTEQWKVGLGSDSQSTTAVTNASHGFTGWMYQTFTFTASSTSEALSFLAIGTPISPSEPPFALLADVSFAEVAPEPGTWSMMLGGLGLFGLSVIRSRRGAQRKK